MSANFNEVGVSFWLPANSVETERDPERKEENEGAAEMTFPPGHICICLPCGKFFPEKLVTFSKELQLGLSFAT